MNLTTLTLSPEQLKVLQLILEFHSDDTPDEHYDFNAYADLCERVGLPRPVRE